MKDYVEKQKILLDRFENNVNYILKVLNKTLYPKYIDKKLEINKDPEIVNEYDSLYFDLGDLHIYDDKVQLPIFGFYESIIESTSNCEFDNESFPFGTIDFIAKSIKIGKIDWIEVPDKYYSYESVKLESTVE